MEVARSIHIRQRLRQRLSYSNNNYYYYNVLRMRYVTDINRLEITISPARSVDVFTIHPNRLYKRE